MTSAFQLQEMAAIKGHEIIISKYNWKSGWACVVEGAVDDIAFKCIGEGGTFPEAVEACYRKWQHIAGVMPEFSTMIAPPEAEFEVIEG